MTTTDVIGVAAGALGREIAISICRFVFGRFLFNFGKIRISRSQSLASPSIKVRSNTLAVLECFKG